MFVITVGLEAFYKSLAGGIVFIVLFLIWAIVFIETLLGGNNESRLQQLYGEGTVKKGKKDRKKTITRLVLYGIALIVIAVIYYFFI